MVRLWRSDQLHVRAVAGMAASNSPVTAVLKSAPSHLAVLSEGNGAARSATANTGHSGSRLMLAAAGA